MNDHIPFTGHLISIASIFGVADHHYITRGLDFSMFAGACEGRLL
jgi:hypothetical protein